MRLGGLRAVTYCGTIKTYVYTFVHVRNSELDSEWPSKSWNATWRLTAELLTTTSTFHQQFGSCNSLCFPPSLYHEDSFILVTTEEAPSSSLERSALAEHVQTSMYRTCTVDDVFQRIEGTAVKVDLNLIAVQNFEVTDLLAIGLTSIWKYVESSRSKTTLMASSFGNMWMAPTPEPTQPPKRETSPMPLPMVGLGNNQVRMTYSYLFFEN